MTERLCQFVKNGTTWTCIAGVSLAYAIVMHGGFLLGAGYKIAGKNGGCSWERYLHVRRDLARMEELGGRMKETLHIVEEDQRLGLVKIQSPSRPFWLKRAGRRLDAITLLAYILAEQSWVDEVVPSQSVRAGQTVVDVGAHVGTFGDHALQVGAAKVIMIEPDPVNVECLRRNFAKEIADGRVVIVPEGAWNSNQTIEFAIGVDNSGMGSMVLKEAGARKIYVQVRPLDDILAGIHVERVDYIKMDIEGAEREALAGGRQCLARFKPRLMLDAYHRPDDLTVLPKIIVGANAAYREVCGPCEFRNTGRFTDTVSHTIFFE